MDVSVSVKYDDDASGKLKQHTATQRWQRLSNSKRIFTVLCSLVLLSIFAVVGARTQVVPFEKGYAQKISLSGKSTGEKPPSLPALKDVKPPPVHKNMGIPKPPLTGGSMKVPPGAEGILESPPMPKPPLIKTKKRQQKLKQKMTSTKDSENEKRKTAVVGAMKHAWLGYTKCAWGKDQLKPISCSFEQWFDLGLTLIDALDTLYLMDLKDEFKKARDWVANSLNFDKDVDVNLFETTIRVLGGLLSTYSLSKDKLFLDKAVDLGDRLMAGFETASGIPFSDVNIGKRTAHGPQWSDKSSSSEVTTLQLEFKYLSKLTGDDKYREAVENVMNIVDRNKPADGLIPIWISPHSGKFTGSRITLGARGDSYYEYLLKQWIQTGKGDDRLKEMYLHAIESVDKQLVGVTEHEKLMFIKERNGGSLDPKMDHLVCFMSGTLALGAHNGLGGGMTGRHMHMAKELGKTCYKMYEKMPFGLSPEIMMFNEKGADDMFVKPADEHNLLRPETIESLFILYRVTKDPMYREWGWKMFEAFEKHTKVPGGGYTSLSSVKTGGDRDKMESFFLGETLKYFYLLFNDDETKCDLNKVVFNTEAHPLPIFLSTPQ